MHVNLIPAVICVFQGDHVSIPTAHVMTLWLSEDETDVIHIPISQMLRSQQSI